MERSLSCEANSWSASQEIPSHLQKHEVHCRVHKSITSIQICRNWSLRNSGDTSEMDMRNKNLHV